jgi:hypothetical protein
LQFSILNQLKLDIIVALISACPEVVHYASQHPTCPGLVLDTVKAVSHPNRETLWERAVMRELLNAVPSRLSPLQLKKCHDLNWMFHSPLLYITLKAKRTHINPKVPYLRHIMNGFADRTDMDGYRLIGGLGLDLLRYCLYYL